MNEHTQKADRTGLTSRNQAQANASRTDGTSVDNGRTGGRQAGTRVGAVDARTTSSGS